MQLKSNYRSTKRPRFSEQPNGYWHTQSRGKAPGIRSLAEAVILQSLEDLWDPLHRIESLNFFNGDGYKTFSRLAGLNKAGSNKILNISLEKKSVKQARDFNTR